MKVIVVVSGTASYQLQTASSTHPRVIARAETEYMFEGFKPNNENLSIVAAIRWKKRHSLNSCDPMSSALAFGRKSI